jgi:hypothetical protein
MISPRGAANVLLVGLSALVVFHVLMLSGVLPAEIAWGGRAGGSMGSLALLEIVGLIVTVLFAAVVAAKVGYLGSRPAGRAVNVTMWIVFGYFALNVAANLASTSSLERAIFTPVSVVLAAFALRLAVSR